MNADGTTQYPKGIPQVRFIPLPQTTRKRSWWQLTPPQRQTPAAANRVRVICLLGGEQQ